MSTPHAGRRLRPCLQRDGVTEVLSLFPKKKKVIWAALAASAAKWRWKPCKTLSTTIMESIRQQLVKCLFHKNPKLECYCVVLALR